MNNIDEIQYTSLGCYQRSGKVNYAALVAGCGMKGLPCSVINNRKITRKKWKHWMCI